MSRATETQSQNDSAQTKAKHMKHFKENYAIVEILDSRFDDLDSLFDSLSDIACRANAIADEFDVDANLARYADRRFAS
jgi:hypothetical protein